MISTRSLNGEKDELAGYPIIGEPLANDILIFQNGYWSLSTLSASGSIVSISNVGTGAGIFRDIISGTAFLRSLSSSNITIAVSGDEIAFSINSTQPDLRVIGSATNSLTFTPTNINMPNLPIGTGNPTYYVGWGSGGVLNRYVYGDLDISDIQNVGGGAGVFRNILGSVAYLKSLTAQPNLTITVNPDTLDIALNTILNGISELSGVSLNLNYPVITLPTVPAITPAYTLGIDASNNLGYFTASSGGITDIQNLGLGQAIFSNITAGTAYLRSLTSGANINLTGTPDDISVNMNSNISVNEITANQFNGPTILNNYGTGTPLYYLASDASNNLILANIPPNANIYNNDGVLTSNRTISSGGFNLTVQPDTIFQGANISMTGLALNPTPDTYITADVSGNLSRTSLPPNLNIYNSDGFLPANRLMLGNAFNLTLDDTNLILPNNVNYLPENNGSAEYKYLAFDASGNSRMLTCPNNTFSRVITISPLTGLRACLFLILTNVIGGGAPPSFCVDFYFQDNSASANSAVMHFNFTSTLNSVFTGGPQVILPTHATETVAGYPLYILQVEYVATNNLYFSLINSSIISSGANLTMRVVGRGIGIGETATLPNIYSTLSVSPNPLPSSTKMYFQGNSGIGNITSWLWNYNLFPRNIKITVWMQNQQSGMSTSSNYSILLQNNGGVIATIQGRNGPNANETNSIYFTNTYNAYTLIPGGTFSIGLNTMSFIIPASISRANQPFSISIELI